MRVRGIIDGDTVYWAGTGWTMDESQAEELSRAEANRRLRIINANNRFLDRDERVEAVIVESK